MFGLFPAFPFPFLLGCRRGLGQPLAFGALGRQFGADFPLRPLQFFGPALQFGSQGIQTRLLVGADLRLRLQRFDLLRQRFTRRIGRPQRQAPLLEKGADGLDAGRAPGQGQIGNAYAPAAPLQRRAIQGDKLPAVIDQGRGELTGRVSRRVLHAGLVEGGHQTATAAAVIVHAVHNAAGFRRALGDAQRRQAQARHAQHGEVEVGILGQSLTEQPGAALRVGDRPAIAQREQRAAGQQRVRGDDGGDPLGDHGTSALDDEHHGALRRRAGREAHQQRQHQPAQGPARVRASGTAQFKRHDRPAWLRRRSAWCCPDWPDRGRRPRSTGH